MDLLPWSPLGTGPRAPLRTSPGPARPPQPSLGKQPLHPDWPGFAEGIAHSSGPATWLCPRAHRCPCSQPRMCRGGLRRRARCWPSRAARAAVLPASRWRSQFPWASSWGWRSGPWDPDPTGLGSGWRGFPPDPSPRVPGHACPTSLRSFAESAPTRLLPCPSEACTLQGSPSPSPRMHMGFGTLLKHLHTYS